MSARAFAAARAPTQWGCRALWAMLLAAICSAHAAFGATPAGPDAALEARMMDLARELRCPVCQNDTVAASQTDLAADLRQEILRQLQAGRNEQQVLDFMVERYGHFVSYRPPVAPHTWMLWFGPFALLALGLPALVRRIRRHTVPADTAAGARIEAAPHGQPDRRPTHSSAQHGAPTRLPPRTAGVLMVGLPVVAALLYLPLGNPEGLRPTVAAPPPTSAGVEITDADVALMVDGLAQRMMQRPDDVAGWTMLGRSYATLRRFDEASAAYARAVTLSPSDAQLLADHADVLAMAQGQDLRGEPLRLIERALALDPRQPKALALAGTAALERHDAAGAIAYWERARQAVPPDSAFAKAMQARIDDTRSRTGTSVGTPMIRGTSLERP